MSVIQEMQVKLSANVDKFKDGMKDATSEMKNLKNVGGMASKDIGKSFATLGAGMAVAGTAIVATLGAIAGAAVKTAGEIDKYAKMSGMTSEETQRLDGIFRTVGWSMEQAGGDMAMFSERMLDAKNGVGDGAEFFKMLGVKTTNADGSLRNANETFMETIKALQNIENPAERAAIATALLGTTGEEIAGLYGLTNEQLDELAGKVNVVDNDTIEKAKQFGAEWAMIKYNLGQTALAIGSELLPTLKPMMESVMGVLKNVVAWVKENPKLTQGILMFIGILGGLMLALAPLLMIIGGLVAMGATVGGVFIGIGVAIGAVMAIVICALTDWDKFSAKVSEVCNNVADWLNEMAIKALEALGLLALNVALGAVKVVGAIANGLAQLPQKVKEWFGKAKDGAIDLLVQMTGMSREKATGIVTAISGVIGKVFDIMTKPFTSAWNLIGGIFDKIANGLSGIIGKANRAKDAVSGVQSNGKGGSQNIGRSVQANTMSMNVGDGARSGGTITVPVSLDGKVIATASAPYMQTALSTMNTRNNRLIGVL